MASWLNALLSSLAGMPPELLFLVLTLAAAVENLFPPFPSDSVIVFGGFLSGRGMIPVTAAFLAVWIGNVSGALLVYAGGRRYGPTFFSGRLGEFLLRPQQLAQLSEFYRRYGISVVFFSRFVPMFRAVVPVFAGVSHLGFWRTAIPLAAASAIWYGTLVYLGAVAGRNWGLVVELVSSTSRWLWGLAIIFLAIVAWRWYKSR